MSKIVFEKGYERDTTFILQAPWARDLAGDNYLAFGKGNPNAPLWIQYFDGSNTQFWENKEGMKWFGDQLLEKNQNGESFMRGVVADQREVIKRMRPYWEKNNLEDPLEVEAYLALVHRAMTNITLYFYAGLDERTPKSIQDVVVEMRKEDDFGTPHQEFVRRIFAAKGYSEEMVNVIMPEEFLNPPSKEELGVRACGVVMIDGKELFIGTLIEFAKTHPEFEFIGLNGMEKEVSEVRGQIAQKGKVTGKVRVVKNRAQANLVEEGEVIVSPMTTPDFIVGMHKAAAFVTDEGGIVCHAAIVAREMKKPCIIGTKIGSQVFKDGDMVEVDADRGIVRILK